ncbi:TetR/AcrR family transcriptional regulator [Frankia sp. AgKG'84/4]|uniref:TetR/AcrR family transcriptional regulator n=1 Tax=Frankia sp. AgKG'84/4 TaxID=573490 RepID=UPI00200D84BE|nr:TetR/AcrR family transcriptional regulator [Frankia sp. AgKG'84/4]MCL9794648.1 TetR/AcrR family transcriptional regulator [Frankia sp. AgKG'84/4]
MPQTERPLRADARRNRERILTSAGDLFARRGNDVQMEEIAAHSGLGMGTLYRHFPSKRDLLMAVVRERFQGMSQLALDAERIDDPGHALEAVLRGYLEAAEGDAAFQLAILGSQGLSWDGVEQQKVEFADIVARIIDRAVAAGRLRADFSVADFPMLACGIMSTMYFQPGGNADWRRHLDLVLAGIRAPGTPG